MAVNSLRNPGEVKVEEVRTTGCHAVLYWISQRKKTKAGKS
jgi:hypothetical protein